MELTSASFENDARIPPEFAFCVPNSTARVSHGSNRNPQVAWTDLPMGTRSLVLICHDPDVPSLPDDVNQEGRTISESMLRIDFYHWLLVDLDPYSGPIEAGEFSEGVTPRGKSGPPGPRATRQGINDYTDWFAADDEMKGAYYGYDGPCPPWNDTLLHHYVFTLYALDVEQLGVSGTFRGKDALNAMKGHVLEEAKLTGVYSLNPEISR